MSYTKTIQQKIAVKYSGNIYYPAAQNGDSLNYSGTSEDGTEYTVISSQDGIRVRYNGTTYEEVNVDITVETEPFDQSVEHVNNHIGGLTSSVVAMNSAQCESIIENADRVAKSITDGFFHTVRTEIGTQKTELQQVIDSRLMLLRQQKETLLQKRQNMEHDYARTSERYQKIFDDLNNELSLRIHELDQSVFSLVREMEQSSDRMLHTDLVQSAATISRESQVIEAQIGMATVKNHALETMQQAQQYLVNKARTERTLHDSVVEGSGKDQYLAPLIYMETEGEKHERKCHVNEHYAEQCKPFNNNLCKLMDETNLSKPTNNEQEQLQSYLQDEIAQHLTGNDDHSQRVRAMINQMFNETQKKQ